MQSNAGKTAENEEGREQTQKWINTCLPGLHKLQLIFFIYTKAQAINTKHSILKNPKCLHRYKYSLQSKF